ncbi:helix-turn-helix domain-containing protein [Candidatus Bathyarchaeota archaeon]|nr:helix-turn-helix domain-containing protein [Candidatus Bathyarchaeota archaeon]
MVLYEVALRVRHDCPYLRLTEDYPSASIYVWCNRETEVLELKVGDDSEYDAAVDALYEFVEALTEVRGDGESLTVIRRCVCLDEDSVLSCLDEFNLYPLSPVVHREGWEHYHFIAFDHGDVEGLFTRLHERGFTVEVVKKTTLDKTLAELMTLPTSALFSDLTEKQVSALVSAYNYGYYKFPREINVQEMADRLRVPRTTLQDHLKKAHGKVMDRLMPYLLLTRTKKRY